MRSVEEHLIAKNIAYNFAAQAILFLLGFVTTPFIIHRLGAEIYGIFSIMIAVTGYFSILDFGLGLATVKYIAEYQIKDNKESLQKIIGTALTTYILLGFAGGLLIFILTGYLVTSLINIPSKLVPMALVAFYISALGFFINMLLAVFNAIPTAIQRMDITNTRNILFGFINILGIVILLSLGRGLIDIVAWGILTSLLATLLFYRIIKKLLPKISLRPSFDKQIFLSLLKFGGFKLVGNASGQIVFQLDKLLIGIFRPISDVTFYMGPVMLVQKSFAVLANVTTAVFPAISQSQGSGDIARIRDLYLRMTKLTVFLLLPFFTLIFIFADKILLLWLGDEFASKSTVVLKILAPAYFVASLSSPGVTLLDAIGKPKIPAMFALISAIINLSVALILIPQLGIQGAAWALFINFIVQVPIFIYLVNKKIIKVANMKFIKLTYIKPGVANLVAVLVCINIISLPSKPEWSLFLGLILFSSVYLLTNYFINTFDQDDKRVLAYIWHKVRRKR